MHWYIVYIIALYQCRYLQQFKDLYTEEGRKSVKICNYIPSQQSVQNATQQNSESNQGQSQSTQNALHIDANTSDTSETDASVSGSSSLQSNSAAVSVSSNLSSLQTYGQKLAAFQQQHQQQQQANSIGVTQTGIAVNVASSNTLYNTKTTPSSGKRG